MDGRSWEWQVTWEVQVDGETAAEAAREARNVQLDPASTATVFKVARNGKRSETIDLGPLEYRAFVLVLGNAVDGLAFRGPFPTVEAATEYGEERHSREAWTVAEMFFEV